VNLGTALQAYPYRRHWSWVSEYEIEYENEFDDNDEEEDERESQYRFFVTTKRLLANVEISNRIHADLTYKLIWQGYPCLIVGTTDMDKQFHPYGFAVCSNEKQKDFEFVFKTIKLSASKIDKVMQTEHLILVADGTEAIRNAFSRVFGENKNMVMCWAHMRRFVEKKLTLVEEKSSQSEIMDDIETSLKK
jgi:hypothetical protein